MHTILSLPSTVQKFERKDKIVFVNPDIPSWLVTNKNGALLMSLCDGSTSVEDIVDAFCESQGEELSEKVEEFFRQAVASRIFEMPEKGSVPIKEERQQLSMVQLSISEACNLDCKYCYATDRREHHGMMSLDDYKNVVDDVVSHFGPVRFSITGGEPLMNKDCFHIAAYIKSRGCVTDLLTNATMLDESNIQKVKDNFERVTVSLDGSTKELHETFRGPNTYDRTQHAISLLKDYQIPYMLSMTVNKLNIADVENMAQKYKGNLNFAPLFPAGNAKKGKEDIAITGRQYYQALKQASGVNPLGYCESTLDEALICRRCKCAIGGAEISISASGDVYPCQLLHYPEFLIGNIHEGKISEMISDSPVLEKCAKMTVDNIKGCATCAIKYICGGACRARSFHECGDIMSTSPFCEYEKEAFIDGMIEIYSKNALGD